MARIAEIDRAILAHLRRNGRMSCVELAKDIGASEKTIRTHMKKMEENGIIRGYTIREGGVGLTALVRIKVLPGCLLYTSPSPRDRSLSRMPSSA